MYCGETENGKKFHEYYEYSSKLVTLYSRRYSQLEWM